MQIASFPAPALYGDHHALEVRRILLSLPGVSEVYASSCFHMIEATYDPAQVSPEEIASTLKKAGYLASLPIPDEALAQAPHSHTVTVEQNRPLGFQQETTAQNHSLWPCPGMGLLEVKEN